MLTTKFFSSIFELCLSILTGRPIVRLLVFFVFRLKGKFRWLSEELKARLSTERRLKEQADWAKRELGFVWHLVKNITRKVATPLTRHALLPAWLAIRLVRLRHKYWSLLLVTLVVPQFNQCCCLWRYLFHNHQFSSSPRHLCHSQANFVGRSATCATGTNFLPRHATCSSGQPILLLVTLFVPQWKQFCCWPRRRSVLRMSEVPCADILAVIFSLWNRQRWHEMFFF